MLDINELLKILAPSVISAGVAYYAIIFSFKRFNAEKWREKKFHYYIDAIEVTNDIIKICDELIKNSNGKLILHDYEKKSLNLEFNAKRVKFGGLVNVGKLVFSDAVNRVIMNFDNELYGVEIINGDPQKIAAIRDNGEGMLNELIRTAKLDLKSKSIFDRT